MTCHERRPTFGFLPLCLNLQASVKSGRMQPPEVRHAKLSGAELLYLLSNSLFFARNANTRTESGKFEQVWNVFWGLQPNLCACMVKFLPICFLFASLPLACCCGSNAACSQICHWHLWHGSSSSLALPDWTRGGPENGLAASTAFCAFGQFCTARFCCRGAAPGTGFVDNTAVALMLS